MDIVRIISKCLGEGIVYINEEDEIEEVLEVLCKMPVKHLANWITEGLSVLPDDVTVEEILVDEDGKYESILDESFDQEKLLSKEQIAELVAKFGGEEVEPE